VTTSAAARLHRADPGRRYETSIATAQQRDSLKGGPGGHRKKAISPQPRPRRHWPFAENK
jgi:hypothetical protein